MEISAAFSIHNKTELKRPSFYRYSVLPQLKDIYDMRCCASAISQALVHHLLSGARVLQLRIFTQVIVH
jgi:hypothetical protein